MTLLGEFHFIMIPSLCCDFQRRSRITKNISDAGDEKYFYHILKWMTDTSIEEIKKISIEEMWMDFLNDANRCLDVFHFIEINLNIYHCRNVNGYMITVIQI